MNKPLAALCYLLLGAAAAVAQPVQGSGAEVAWTAPQEGAVLDVAQGTEKSVPLRSPRRLPSRGWLVARVRGGDVAWVHLDRDPEARAVRFAFLSGGLDGAAAVEAVPERRAPGDFLFRIPIGPATRLGISVRAGQAAPRAQLWVGAVQSPGFRWELWEEQAKRWAAHPKGLPPAPPDLEGDPLIDKLALVADAVALAQAESPHPAPAAVAALLGAEALLADQPSREPLFPYFRRYDLTRAVAQSRPLQKVEDERMFAARDGELLRFPVAGPGFLRIEARAQFGATAPHHPIPLQLLLRVNNRMLGLAAEEVLAKEPTEPGPGQISSRRRIAAIAAPGRHTYELQVRGGPAWVSVIMHTRVTHAEDLTSHSEDIVALLQRTRTATGLLAELLSGEASFLALDDDRARASFQRVAETALSPRLHAFALLRLTALLVARNQAADATRTALALLENQTDDAAARLRNSLVAQHLTQVAAETRPGEAAPAEAVALLLATPGALPYMLGVAGPILRYVSGPRSLALPLLDAAQRHAPLNGALRHYLAREWFTGTRWASLPAIETAGAVATELLVPPLTAVTCAEARDEGMLAYTALPDKMVALQVPPSLAPPPFLHRFSLVALRRGVPRLGWAELTLDGEATRLPLVLMSEQIRLALAAGHHTLRGTLSGESAGALLGPCELSENLGQNVLLVEHHFSALVGRGAQTRVVAPEAGKAGFFGLELRLSPALRAGRLLVRTEQGVLARIEVDGHGLDPLAAGQALGPSVALAIPLPAAAQIVDIVREDDGAPLLVRALLRRSLAKVGKPESRQPVMERAPQPLALLRQATRALRHEKDGAAQARVRLQRAELLVGLNALALARNDLERGLPALRDVNALTHARALLAAAAELPLLPEQPSGRSAVVLSPGANLDAATAQASCITGALARFAVAPDAGRAAMASCPSLVGRYAAARLEEQGGSALRAAQHYAKAYLQALAQGLSRPALARQAALQYAERGPGPGSKQGLALATAAALADDPEGARAVGLVRGLLHTQSVRGVDAGELLRMPEGGTAPLSLPAALADVPWEAGRFLEAHAGRTTETDIQVKNPVRVRVEIFCDDQGEPSAPTPPCSLRLAVDGASLLAENGRVLPAGQRARIAEVALDRGAHRLQITLGPEPAAAIAFIHFSTSRPLDGAPGEADADGYFEMPITPPPVRRFVGTPAEPVQLRMQGPTVLHIDALVARGAGSRALLIELSRPGHPDVQRTYPVCTLPVDQQAPSTQPAYNCHTLVMTPLVDEGTYQIKIVPVGTPDVALALALYDDAPTTDPAERQGVSALAADLTARSVPVPADPALQALGPPLSNAVRALGTLQVQQLVVFGNAGRTDPQIGDTFAETSLVYRRKLDELPLWFRTGASLRLRDGPASFGLEERAFGRIPILELRVNVQLQAYTQRVEGNQEYALGLHSYLERSFQLVPHLFILPRFAFTASYQTLADRPARSSVSSSPVTQPVTPVDLQVFNQFDAAHQKSVYGQLLLWWVPFINMITYTELRLSSNQTVRMLDSVSARAGFDLALYTTELAVYYQLEHFLVDDARRQSLLWHTVSAELDQTVWLNRNHRLGFQLRGTVEVGSQASTWVLGAFWEGSRGRGLDDYSTPEINLPQQLGRGRGLQKPEETLR